MLNRGERFTTFQSGKPKQTNQSADKRKLCPPAPRLDLGAESTTASQQACQVVVVVVALVVEEVWVVHTWLHGQQLQ